MLSTKRLKMQIKPSFFIIFLLSLLFPYAAIAKNISMAGNWKTVSDTTHKVASIVKIWKYKGSYYGRVIKIYNQGGNKATDRCVKCSGSYKNKPILGMTILFDMKPVTSSDSQMLPKEYSGGKILDPKTGSLYRCNITLLNNKKLKVRGYIGISLFGRSQMWYR